MNRFDELPPSVQGYLREFVVRRGRIIALRAVGTALLVLAVCAFCAAAADRFLHLPASIRLISMIAAGATAVGVGLARLRLLRGPVDWVAMAGIIEQHDPRFQQALVTVTSRILGSPEQRGSDEILAHLLREVESRAADRRQRQLYTFRSAARPWIALLILALIASGLARIPGIGAARLLARVAEPFGNVPAVTTTELKVLPRDADVLQSEALHINVEAARLGANPVMLHLSDDGENWTQYSMDDAGGGHFTYTLNSVGRDLLYKITGGDAVSGPYAVHVKRPPAVVEYRIRYTYPAYTRRPPMVVTNTDGAIEAPAGSDALLTIVSTEPLQSALLTMGGQKILMDRPQPDAANVRQASLHVQNDQNYEVDLISSREVRGGSGKLSIHATLDHPPLARLFQAGQTLRLNPHDVLPLTYQVMDDYGLENLAIVAQVNADAPVRMPLRLTGDHRRQEETVDFDLGTLHFQVGDVLSLTIAVRDTAAQEAFSDEVRVLISPRSIDLDARERIDELSAAAGYSASLVTEFAAATKAADEADGQKDHQSTPYLAAAGRASRHLSGASESATILKQSLLRATAHSDRPELSIALCAWIDAAQLQNEIADEAFGKSGSSEGIDRQLRDRLHRAWETARDLNNQLAAVARGERAAGVLVDRQDFKAASAPRKDTQTDAADRLARTLAHINDEITASATEVGVSASAANADDELRSRVQAAKDVIRSKQAVDFASASREWSQVLQRDAHVKTGFDQRLAAAAQAEAVRKDADLQCARDLDLAARAAGVIEASINQLPEHKPVPPGQLNAFAGAMAALHREHLIVREPASSHSADELKVARNLAGKAREEIARFSGEAKETKNAVASARAAEMQSLALRAGAAAARRDYKKMADEDKALTQKLTDAARMPAGHAVSTDMKTAATQAADERVLRIGETAEKIARHMSNAEAVDKLGQFQDKLAQEARDAKKASRDLAGRQRTIADQIAGVEKQRDSAGFAATSPTHEMDDPNWRGRATAALLFAQEQLAEMPQDLALTQQAADRRQKAASRAAVARHEADTADADRKEMVMRAADQAEQDAKEAVADYDKVSAPVTPEIAVELAERLDPFAPEASTARELVDGPLSSALTALAQAARGDDGDAVGRAAGDALKAIDAVQKELSGAQDEFTRRDPLVAAKWFARAAADSPARHPNDLRAALAHQNNVSIALSRAWDRSVHRASDLRLAELPSFQAVYNPSQSASPEMTTASAGSQVTAVHDWVRLHSREGDDLTATMHDADPPGFEEPLRLYFEAIGKAQEKPAP